jgi:hypothetical protein
VSDDRGPSSELDRTDIDRRIRDLERETLNADPLALRDERSPEEAEAPESRRRRADGSLGDMLSLLVGLAMIGAGLLVYLSRVFVWGGFWFGGGQLSIGLLFGPLILGVALAVTGGRVLRLLGVALVAIAVVGLFGVSLSSLRLFFLPTPLLDVMAILALIGAGIGLTIRGARRL